MQKRKNVPLKFILDFYDAWLRDADINKVAAALEINYRTLEKRLQDTPQLAEAKKIADEKRAPRESLGGYVFKHLSPEAKRIWDELQFWEDGSNFEQIEKILNGKTKKLRQELFVHALINSNFDPSTACSKVGVSMVDFQHWRNDLEFRQLIEEIQWHKKNFFEKALVDLVEIRHPGATVFVNKTINRDRGYGEHLEVEHTGQVNVGLSIEDLDLPIEVRAEILKAIRKKQPRQLNTPPDQQQSLPVLAA